MPKHVDRTTEIESDINGLEQTGSLRYNKSVLYDCLRNKLENRLSRDLLKKDGIAVEKTDP